MFREYCAVRSTGERERAWEAFDCRQKSFLNDAFLMYDNQARDIRVSRERFYFKPRAYMQMSIYVGNRSFIT